MYSSTKMLAMTENNAAGGGPVELITDVNWAEGSFQTAKYGY